MTDIKKCHICDTVYNYGRPYSLSESGELEASIYPQCDCGEQYEEQQYTEQKMNTLQNIIDNDKEVETKDLEKNFMRDLKQLFKAYELDLISGELETHEDTYSFLLCSESYENDPTGYTATLRKKQDDSELVKEHREQSKDYIKSRKKHITYKE